jgi:alanine dehydrogenase
MLPLMKEGSVIVDVSVDQGGCIETTHPTTHSNPTFVVDGIVHYGVANMPGAVSRTSTFALTNATLPYGLQLADLGPEEAIRRTAGLRPGANVWRGKVTNEPVARDLGYTYHPLNF